MSSPVEGPCAKSAVTCSDLGLWSSGLSRHVPPRQAGASGPVWLPWWSRSRREGLPCRGGTREHGLPPGPCCAARQQRPSLLLSHPWSCPCLCTPWHPSPLEDCGASPPAPRGVSFAALLRRGHHKPQGQCWAQPQLLPDCLAALGPGLTLASGRVATGGQARTEQAVIRELCCSCQKATFSSRRARLADPVRA